MTIGAPPLIDHVEGPVNIDSMDSLLADFKRWLCMHNWVDADSSRVSYNNHMGETCVFEGSLGHWSDHCPPGSCLVFP